MPTHLASPQLALFDTVGDAERAIKSSTFQDNLALPVHRWFRYSAGFSALWAREVIERERELGRTRVLDPFAGSATVLLEAERCHVEAAGVEAHPFVWRVARAKLHWTAEPDSFLDHAQAIMRRALASRSEPTAYPDLIHRCYPPDVLRPLHRLQRAWQELADDGPCSELAWLCLVSVLRDVSPVNTAQSQYVQPRKAKANAQDARAAFLAKARLMADDMRSRQSGPRGPAATLHRDDARSCAAVGDGWADLVITSPPYPNNFDYADATRLEMSFLGEVGGWGDLQGVVRQYLVRSCTQHVAGLNGQLPQLLAAGRLAAISDELSETCRQLAVVREQHGGKKAYHAMIAAYFHDLAQVFLALRRATRPGCLMCFVIGDSAPYGVYVPVERWLGELAVAAGFTDYRFEKTRDRNTKWKNRKHRVPLHEGRLWIRG